jgi:hypothetical protein
VEISKTGEGGVVTVDAAGVLLRDLIDYAGLFPPAALAMAPSVTNYNEYLQSQWNWVLGRFIVPVARLNEFEEAFYGLPSPTPDTGTLDWRLSTLLGDDVATDITCIREFNARVTNSISGRRAIVESVEVKVANPEEIANLAEIIPAELATYFEIPLVSCDKCIAALAKCGRRAKIRTGGETADKFPAPESVIEFIRLCAAANVPFKATAGLHHPLRSVHRFTYHPESPSGMMHGFINVFLAAAFLWEGMEPDLAVQLLEEQSAQAFHFSSDEIEWREHRLDRHEIAAARRGFAVAFGSCSFTEPIDDLQSLYIL